MRITGQRFEPVGRGCAQIVEVSRVMEHVELSQRWLFDAAEPLHKRAHPQSLGSAVAKRLDHAIGIYTVVGYTSSVQRAADAVRSLPRLRGRVGVGACVHKSLLMLGTRDSLDGCPLPVPPPQAGEGTLEPLGRFVRPRPLTRAGRSAASASRMPSLMLTRITCRSRICGNGRRAGTIVTQNKHEETPCGHLA